MFNFDDIGLVSLRLFLIFVTALFVVRRMGNRTVGQLSPFDFMLMVGIGDIVVAVALETDTSLIPGVEALVGLLLLQQLMAWMSLKNKVLRKWFEGSPVQVIENGRLLQENLEQVHLNDDDLRQELHKLGMDMRNIKDIQAARLEGCGVFTVIRNPQSEPLTRADFEEYLLSCEDNPLSPQGQRWRRIEQALADIEFIATTLRAQSKNDTDSVQDG